MGMGVTMYDGWVGGYGWVWVYILVSHDRI